MGTLSKAHDLAYRLMNELEELKEGAFTDCTIDELERLHEQADEVQAAIYDLIEEQL